MRAALVSGLIACLFWPQALLAALPDGLAGTWHGTVEVEADEVPVRAVVWAQADGFEVELDLPEVPALRAHFVPSERPRVFEVAAAPRGLFGFFNGGERGNPFDGEPLVWARASGLGIVAYRLTIAGDGGMALLRIVLEPVDGQLQMSVQQRIDADPPSRLEILLEPAG